ncbi:DUF5590 domain-containing protein [Cytobacillus sp. Hz8]|uniref:cell wall elongation regulator TseB-like domain-containing protein n=1 Tax=Cytobacillus sp. Hz8 TaxID=3347168 RepID=UPI0035DB48B4
MKKWIWISILIVVVLLGLTIKVYLKSVEPVKAAENRAISIAKEQIHLKSVSDFNLYNGSKSYSVVTGTSEEGQKLIIWVPEDNDNIIVRRASEGITKEKALEKVKSEKNPSNIISIRLGMENNRPLWEIYYQTDKNLLNYYYIDFITGEWLKDIENL